MNNRMNVIAFLLALALVSGCAASYVTPGGGFSMGAMAGIDEQIDGDISKHFETRPAAAFPAHIAVVRIQDSGYRTKTQHGYGHGRYSVVTTRDIETDEAFERLQKLPDVNGVAPIGRMLVPVNANSIKDLRIPAARLHADMVLVYSVDTSLYVDGKQLGPLSMISLGLIPNKKAHVTATVAGMLVDVRTGYIYGTTEASDTQEQRTTVWATEMAIEKARAKAETNAFEGFVGEFEELWDGVVGVYGDGATASRGDNAPGNRYFTIPLGSARQESVEESVAPSQDAAD